VTPLGLDDVRDLAAWERVRVAERARVIALKRARRVALGERLSLLFENRDTVLFQVQEMVRAERLVEPARIQAELDVYNPLLPGGGELSATLFIEIPEIARLGGEETRREVERFRGIERDALVLVLGEHRVAARFEAAATPEERLAAVHFVRFALGAAARTALADPGRPLELRVEHPAYAASARLGEATRRALLADVAA
jgi:hypothetical protein